MDLVKIGFQINANGLKDANKEVDNLLAKVDNIGTKGKKASSDFESSQKKVQDSVKKTEKVSTSASDKMIQKQQTLNQLLPYMDKNTANLASSFWLVSKEAQSFNKYLDLLESNKAIDEQKKQVERLAKEQAKASASEEVARQKRLLADQNYYQKVQEQARKTEAKELERLQREEARAESLRQKKLLSEQNYYLRVQEEAKKASAKEQEALKRSEAEQEALRQKRLLSEQNYYLKTQEEAKKAAAKEKALQQKAIDDAEKARQQSLLRVQNNYIKQQEAIAKAQQKAIDKQIASQKALNDANQKAITLEQAKAKYVSQGYGKTDSTRLARLEVSGADVTTLNNYKSAIDATTRATQALNPTIEKATTSHNKFLDQVKGIAIYAALSAAIYGVMTAMTNLAVATVKMADEYTSIQNRMKLYITDAKELGKVNSQLAQFSMENNVGLRETATLFSRLAPSMQKLGANTAAITTVVDAFGKSMRIGGATAMEAASATIQFSQAMASGKLAGDEFRSISEASPRFLKAIAEGSGIAADKLKEMSAAGMLTTQVISKALLKEYPKLIEENKKLGVTMEQGANAIKTGFLVAIGEFNEGAGITKALGEAMMDLAQGMLTGAQNARQFGKDVNAWFSANADTISNVVDAVKILATVIVSRYVASLVLATAASVKLTYQTSALGAATTASMRAFVLGTTAVTAFGRAAQTAFAFMGGWAGIALTVAGVASSYLLMKDNAAQANAKLVEQSEYANKATSELSKLNAEQKKNAGFKLTLDISEANANLEKAQSSYVALVQVMSKKSWASGLTKEVNNVAKAVNEGSMSFDEATRKLLEMGAISEEQAQKLNKQTGIYNEAASSANLLSKAAQALGVDFKLGGNEAQNATPAIANLKDQTKQLGDEAVIAGSKFNKMTEDFKKAIKDSRDTLKIMQQFDLEESYARKVVTGVRATFDPLEQKATELSDKIKVLNKQLSGMDKASPQAKSMQSSLDKAKESLSLMQQQIELGKKNQAASLAPYAKIAQAEEDRISALTASRKDEDKSLDKVLKKREEVLAGYEDQVNYVQRIQQLLSQGVDFEVAKVAATKDYYENITGTMLAQEVILAQQTQKRLEYLATLSEEEDIQTRAVLLQQKGASYAQSRALAEAGFREDADGLLTLQKLMTNELYAQHYSLDDQLSWYTSINKMLKDGVSLEEATTRATFSRLEAAKKGLTDSDKSLMNLMLTQQKNLKLKETERQVTLTLTNAEKQRVAYVNAQAGGYANLIKNMAIANKIASDTTLSPDQAKKLVEAEELTNYEKELAELKRQTYIASLNESEAVKTLVGNYSTMDSVQIGVLANQQRLLEIAKELSEEAEKQKNPLGDFSNVDFSVFGDFGNPFQSALDGMNELIRTTMSGGEQIKKLNEEIDAAKLKGLDTTQQEFDLNLEMQKQTKDKKQATDKAISSALSLTKSLFKEESKGYKVVSGLEKAYQASKIAFALWEKKDTIAMLALSLKAHITDMLGFTTGAAAKLAAQGAVNVAKGTEAVLSQGSGDPYTAFPRMAAMAAAVVALGVAIGSFSGGSSEYVDTSNQGTGTVFGDSEAQSASIANSIDLLSENSDLMLPLTSAMLRSLRNIESSIGGVTNLILRGELGSDFSSLEYDARLTGIVGEANDLFVKVTNGLESIGLTSFGLGSSIVSSVVGGLFGKTSQKVVASGLYAGDQTLGSILENGMSLSQYADVKTTKKSWFGSSSSTKTKYASVDEELQQQFTLIFVGLYDSILSATDILGADLSTVQTNLENAVVSIGKINLQGLSGEEIQEKLEAVFGAVADDLAKQAFGGLEDFQTVGEGYYETLMKVASAVEEAAYYTDRLNVTAINYNDIINKQADDLAAEIIRQSYLAKEGISTVTGGMSDLVNSFSGTAEEISDFITTLEDLQEQLFMTGQSGDYLTSSMILGAGGTDSLASGLDAYFEMLSPAEQAAELTRRLTNEFDLIGQTLPSDVKAFRALVNSIDITTEAGQKLYGQIIALAPEFNDLQDAIESANSEVNALVQSLRDLAEQARAARGETEQPRDLDYLRNEFNKASELALQGDTEAANRLISISEDLMSASKLYSVTGSDYARDLAYIQGVATAVADLQESGLGTSISSDLTPSTTTGTTTPTIETTNTTMTTEMQSMREELNAGLFAIAKFVQNLDSRTERWDDGNRVMVGVIQETGDPKLNVTVI